MCFTCGMRNIPSAAAIATQYFPGEVVFPVMCGTLFQQVFASIIGHLFERLTGEERAAQRKRVDSLAAMPWHARLSALRGCQPCHTSVSRCARRRSASISSVVSALTWAKR